VLGGHLIQELLFCSCHGYGWAEDPRVETELIYFNLWC
jgi:hypothetical protein